MCIKSGGNLGKTDLIKKWFQSIGGSSMQEPVRVSELIGESEMISPPQPLDDLAHRDPKAKVSC